MTPAELHTVLGLMRNPYGRDPELVRGAILRGADELERLHRVPSENINAAYQPVASPGTPVPPRGGSGVPSK